MKRLFSMLIVTCMLVLMTTSVYAVEYGEELQKAPTKTYEQKFSDVTESHWAYSYISEMAERGVLSGYPDGRFYPDSQVTRAEFAKIMTIAAGLSVTNPTAQIFSDVQITDWYAPYVHTAKDYLSAYTRNDAIYYLPTTPALREDIAVALVKLKGYSTTGADLSMLERMFSDYQSISESAKVYVATAIENGLVSGYSDGTFKGQNGVTRAEAAALLWRAYQYGNDDKIHRDNQMDEPAESKKPYVMRKLSDAKLDNSNEATLDDHNMLYYIDSSDNCVYSIDTKCKSKIKYLETKHFRYSDKKIEDEREIECEYTSFVPVQVFYDNFNDKLLLTGYYTKLTESYISPKDNMCLSFVYDITDDRPKMLCKIDYDINRYNDGYWIQAPLNDEMYAVTSCNGMSAILNIINGSLSKIDMEFACYTLTSRGYSQNLLRISGLNYNNRLFSCGDGGSIYEYDFNKDTYKSIAHVDYFRAMGQKGVSYYFWDSEQIYKLSVDDGKVSILDINTKNENVFFEDMSNLNNIDFKFFVINDSTFVFYDTNMKAFRILEIS